MVGPAAATPADLQEQADFLAIGLQETSQVEVAEVRDLITESDDESRVTRFTRVALDSSGYEEAISVGLVRAESSDLDVLEFTDFVNGQIATNPLDDGYAAVVTADFATGVDRQLSSLTQNLLTGLLAVAVVSLLLIGWRVALITAGFMGIVMLGALTGTLGGRFHPEYDHAVRADPYVGGCWLTTQSSFRSRSTRTATIPTRH